MDQIIINLPKPNYDSKTSVEQALKNRRSHRSFSNTSLTMEEISQLLWSAQGITDTVDMLRTGPSAGALYPLEIYLISGNVKGLDPGIYKYIPQSHSLALTVKSDHRNEFGSAAQNQPSVISAPVSVLVTAVWSRVIRKYEDRGKQYAWLEAGHVGQSIMLQCVSLGMATVPIGAFYDDQIKTLLKLKDGEDPVYLFPIGRKK